MTQTYAMNTSFRYDHTSGDMDATHPGGYVGGWINDENLCPTGGPFYQWFAPYGDGVEAGHPLMGIGSWDEKRYQSTGASSITHTLGDIEMLYYSASCSYSCDTHSYSYFFNEVCDYSNFGWTGELPILKTCPGPPSAMSFVATFVPGYYLSRTQTNGYKPLTVNIVESSEARCRDYIYHDKINDVAIYIQLEGGGTQNSQHCTITLVVQARGVAHEVVLFNSSSGSRHGTSAEMTSAPQLGLIWPKAIWPTYINSPSIYAPICEQGDFPYIAYTTAAEEAAGVAPRFTLSLPLFVQRHNLTMIEPPLPPSECYGFIAYNLTSVVSIAGDGAWDKLESTVFHIHVSHDGKRDWLTDLKSTENGVLTNHVKGDTEHHFAECYRV